MPDSNKGWRCYFMCDWSYEGWGWNTLRAIPACCGKVVFTHAVLNRHHKPILSSGRLCGGKKEDRCRQQ